MQLLRLRYFQLRRDLGYWALIIAAAAAYVFHEIALISFAHAAALSGAVAMALYSYHLNRKDRGFIDHYLEHPVRQILFNYHLLILPLTLAVAVAGHWQLSVLAHALISLISLLRPWGKTARLLFISRFVPAGQFEWISGIRKNFYTLTVLSALALVLSPVKLFGLAPLLLINSSFISFYAFSEPLLMFNPTHLSPAGFLRSKVNYFTKMLLFTNVPLLAVNAGFNPDSAWFALCFLFAFLLLGACSVYIKYAHYQPNQSQGFHIDQLILFSSVLLPYLLPLAIVLYYTNRKKALANLSHYLQ